MPSLKKVPGSKYAHHVRLYALSTCGRGKAWRMWPSRVLVPVEFRFGDVVFAGICVPGKTPPPVCPICKAPAERFERFLLGVPSDPVGGVE